MLPPLVSHPVLSCAAAQAWEARLLGGDEAREWTAMRAAGRALASAVERDFLECGPWPAEGRVLVLAGKGHNGGDALLAAQALLAARPGYAAEVVFCYGEPALRPLAARAWRELATAYAGRVRLVRPVAGGVADYVLSLDGLFGFQYRPPLDAAATAVLAWANAQRVRMRVAVDLPSGWAEAGAFRADWTYATGILKEPLLDCPSAGRRRYLDLGFFPEAEATTGTGLRVAPATNLAALAGWRAPQADKRTYGHLAVFGGSRHYPGAVQMAVQAALQSGAGLVTAFVPESLVAAAAARLPEAIWVGWPETPAGGLALEGLALWRAVADRYTAGLLGPGLGREPETLVLAAEVLAQARQPFTLDADALQPAVVAAGTRAGRLRVLTPHAGEYARLAGAKPVRTYAQETGAVVVAKGPLPRIATADTEYLACAGGPVLARGGSGDLLAGLVAGLLAQTPDDPAGAAVRGVLWHGLAADALARTCGAVAVRTTQVLDFLPAALRDATPPPPPP